MIQSGTYNIQIRRGDTGTWRFHIQDLDETDQDNPVLRDVDITTWNFTGIAKYNQDDIFFELPITKDNPIQGIWSFYIDKLTSESLVPVNSEIQDSSGYEVQVEIPNGSIVEVATIMVGNFSVVRDLVRSEDSTTPWVNV